MANNTLSQYYIHIKYEGVVHGSARSEVLTADLYVSELNDKGVERALKIHLLDTDIRFVRILRWINLTGKSPEEVIKLVG